jgi:mRNA interferase HigB
MRVVGRDLLTQFCTKHPACRPWIVAWLADVEGSEWKTPRHVKDRYASASFLGNNRVYFNVKGNAYRLETVIAFNTGTVVISWIGTHAEYTKRIS